MKLIIQILLLFLISTANAYNIDFFSRFNDKLLEDYIKEALLNNHDLRSADKRVEQYRYEILNSLSKEFPNLSVSPNYLGVHFPNRDFNIFLENNSFILPFKVNWEADFLLKNRDKINSKKYLYKSQLANQKATYISLLTDVATMYVNILLYDFLIENQKEIIKNQETNLNLNYNKLKFGVIDSLTFDKIAKELYSHKLLYETLIKNRLSSLYNFASLVGRSPNCTDEIKRGSLTDFDYTDNIPEQIEANAIYDRPDIIEIENKLKSARFDILAAKKEFFPSFNIMGILSFDSAGGNFFSWSSSFAYLLAGATQDIFKGGQKIANLKIKKAQFYELIEKYKQTELVAVKEISNALNIIKQDTKNEATSNKQLEKEKSIFISDEKKYKKGVISLVEYTDDKNSYNRQKQLSAASKANRLVDYFTLYKAVGGRI